MAWEFIRLGIGGGVPPFVRNVGAFARYACRLFLLWMFNFICLSFPLIVRA